ncbi:5-demethoxyubiquinol-8 5-hydroxylase UbiM [Novosphingobium sp. FSY-8]|uniref:5-demethoxyubiquinol-8 5-hydroxylase UbiM n=1 Tax=Novosphingobium ovatum TaxID=1908523 RepID=A0ABW9XDJ9_9SPHN|nr:5-demethoxyubiquinol-8 5-hydroxylase UbiM [Novosphingobium ovatum]NBC36621.1 5-demethoxyubiquinol-8 5-hydroxylase UbiM [Novosphingobium ovatum]
MSAFDIVVVGAGPAGLAFVRGLAGSGLRIALIERSSAATLADPPFDGREIALTLRSAETLAAMGAWDRITADDIAPLVQAQVLNGASPFALSFDPTGSAHDRLGNLVPNHAIRRALYQVVAGQDGLTLFDNATVVGGGTDADGVWVDLVDGRRLTGRLLVAADSRFSAVRDWLGIGADINRLGKSMLVCRVRHQGDHHGIATEWFDYAQTYAMLPLNGRMSSAVLTLPSDQINRIAALPLAELSAELTRRYDARLGEMEAVGSPHAYPLATTWAHHFAARRAALIGDAAVGMHPVTAHGFNLGLASADRLAGLVADAAAQGRDIAGNLLLRRYEAGHRIAARPLYVGTNMLVGLYTATHPAARMARHAALRAAARLPRLRQGVSTLLMRR